MNKNSSPKISIIVPCYNQGIYLEESLQSALAQTYKNIEIIIVNDGSTDEQTNVILRENSWPKTKIINMINHGLAEARNIGIRASSGKYILPLDADDKIASEYCEKALEILEANPHIGIVHCQTEYFGARSGKRIDPPFSIREILIKNIILCCSLFRKEDWEKAGGYDKQMGLGGEDWDFWLSLIEIGYQVEKLPNYFFFYRIRERSMARSIDEEKFFEIRKYVFKKHIQLYNKYFPDPLNLYHELVKYKSSYYRLLSSTEYKIATKLLSPIKRIYMRAKGCFKR